METTDGKENEKPAGEKEEITITFRDKRGFPFTRVATNVLLGIPNLRHCMLAFENGEELEWDQSLKAFHRLVYSTNLYRRLGRFLLIKISAVRSRKFRQALLRSGKELDLTRGGNKRLKKYMKKYPPK